MMCNLDSSQSQYKMPIALSLLSCHVFVLQQCLTVLSALSPHLGRHCSHRQGHSLTPDVVQSNLQQDTASKNVQMAPS